MSIEKFLPHQQRVVEEVNNLDENRSKLQAFILSSKFNDVSPEERALMVEQSVAMTKLSGILHARIAIFKRSAEAGA